MSPVKRLFGTDGVRGVANRDLTPDLALALGRAAGAVLASGGGEVVIGRDTRISGSMLEGALAAGFCSAGWAVKLAGVLPSPAVAFLTRDEGAGAGAVISASHNPVEDNGIKFFSGEGMKISAELEERIERAMSSPPSHLPVGPAVGRAEPLPGAQERYLDQLQASMDGSLEGLRVVLDCAFGAAWQVAPRAFAEAGADVVAINAEPDGARINVDCGSTSLDGLSKRVVEEGAQLGLAFDGDADRVLAVDEGGVAVDGDQIMALVALHLLDAGRLTKPIVVATVMSNLGFRQALQQRGLEVVSAPVGDRYVAEAMVEHGALLGGEQSGHVIFSEFSGTGDGLLTGLQIAQIVASSQAPLSMLADIFEPFPQVLINVPVGDGVSLEQSEAVWEDVRLAEESLGQDGRVLVRASGTEPVVRVMVEAADRVAAERTAQELAESVRREAGNQQAKS